MFACEFRGQANKYLVEKKLFVVEKEVCLERIIVKKKNGRNMDNKDQELSAEYLSSLVDLTVNSKLLIDMLTTLAEENIERGQVIVDTVAQHILKVNFCFVCFYFLLFLFLFFWLFVFECALLLCGAERKYR